MEAQSLSVKRAQVEFHNFASLGEPERAARVYAEENARRGALLTKHLPFIGALSPFLEIGARAGRSRGTVPGGRQRGPYQLHAVQ